MKSTIYVKLSFIIVMCTTCVFGISGCATNSNPNDQYKVYLNGLKTQWDITYIETPVDSDKKFEYVLHVASRNKTPDYSFWTTNLKWKQLSQQVLTQELGVMTQLVPHKNYFFYELGIPDSSNTYMQATGVGASLNQDPKNIVDRVMYRGLNDAPIFLANVPLQLASVQADAMKQIVTLTFEPL